ncbi:OmpA family protein [Acidocella sp.]|uniref:OmpA family protein n=1 Tax=Acidocella sp. TaxID=50710 RepID=UPI002637F2E8|nr:OmpA family protein [Acidocella sp.]
MRPFPLFFLLASLLPGAARAQAALNTAVLNTVALNPAALAQLAGQPPAPPPRPAAAPPHIMAHRPAARPKTARPAAMGVKAAPAAQPPAARPLAAPAPAPTSFLPPQPLRLSFAPQSAALPDSAAQALAPYCQAKVRLTISAHAPLTGSAPSAAMRLSLARAQAVQAALEACGVPAANIIPRALGPAPTPADDDTVSVGG